ncbi:rhodanese-like domain-containing protein [Hoyosella sp. G463]|uniref:Rhodanese-like domain-containing protein n=1 Tax=Lolliginicoccus lacisalsi TaxID=2742202 RepID=A0A927JBS5_9ACTN|nr:rhodanese-like domain-containing protein [Lolliginicoccus lacisalsi]MBD8506188.1 rhodanese-like domain-containing protein [Lolliginicoccus lacisalsi]
MREVDVHTLNTAWTGNATVVDVREDFEHARGRVPGAMLIPLGELADRVHEVPRAGRVFVICASGNRSQMGSMILAQAGHDAVSVAGGTAAWARSGYPLERG